MKFGIVGYGADIPRYRIKVEEIAKQWGTDAEAYKKGLQLYQKSVPGADEDTITLSVQATHRAIARAGIDPALINAVYIGSESHPYAVKPSGTIVADTIGACPNCRCADFEFACKAGTEAMFASLALVSSQLFDGQFALGIGADTSQGAPGDALEYSASAGAAAFIMGIGDDVVAEVTHTATYMTDTPDFFRREYQHYPEHGGRFTGEPAYFAHTLGAAKAIMEKSGMKPEEFQHAVFHQPNGKFPMIAGKRLGFEKPQLETGWLSPWLGNTYSGASPISLTAILDVAKPGDKILMVSYGSGAGSDAFIWVVTDKITEVQGRELGTRELLDKFQNYINYGTYAKLRKKILVA